MVIFELLAISKPQLRFRCSLYRFQAISSHLSSGTLGFSKLKPGSCISSHILHMHRIPHPAYHTMFMCWLFTMLCASFRCLLLRVGSVNDVLWGSIHQRPFVFFMDSFFFLAGFQARWPYPRNHFYLCLLVVRSIALPRYLPLALSCLPYCHVKPLTILS